MANSTAIVLTAGALSMGDLILTGWDTRKGVVIGVGTVAAAYVSAGLDKLIPGLGTGLAVVLVLGVVLTKGVDLFTKFNPSGAKTPTLRTV